MLRAARPDDSDSIATVLIECRRVFLPFAPSPHPEHAVRRWVSSTLLSTCRVMVWEEGDQVVAVLAVSEGAAGNWINQLYVLPGWNGKGVGSKLLKYAHQTLTRPIRLYTFQQNTGARRFYERHGYAAVEFTDGQSNEEKCPDVLYVNAGQADA